MRNDRGRGGKEKSKASEGEREEKRGQSGSDKAKK